jgi:hypothetical protein
MAEKKPAPTLPVSMAAKPQQQQQQARAALPFLHIDVRLVNLWTFFNAIAVTITFSALASPTTLSSSPATPARRRGCCRARRRRR